MGSSPREESEALENLVTEVEREWQQAGANPDALLRAGKHAEDLLKLIVGDPETPESNRVGSINNESAPENIKTMRRILRDIAKTLETLGQHADAKRFNLSITQLANASLDNVNNARRTARHNAGQILAENMKPITGDPYKHSRKIA